MDNEFEFFFRIKRDGMEMMGCDYSCLLKNCRVRYDLKRDREILGSLVVNGYGFDLVIMT